MPISTKPAAPTSTAPPPTGPEARRKAAEMRARIHAAVGQVVLALGAVPRYRHQTLADLENLVLNPLLRDRLAIATEKADDNQSNPTGPLAGIAFWASVSDEVDAKIREQIKAGSFPVRLKPEEWTSGNRIWLLDVIAPSQKMASAVLANFKQVVKQDAQVRIHPVVARQVDPELLRRMGAVSDSG